MVGKTGQTGKLGTISDEIVFCYYRPTISSNCIIMVADLRFKLKCERAMRAFELIYRFDFYFIFNTEVLRNEFS